MLSNQGRKSEDIVTLGKGGACHQCRTHKVKCSGSKPICFRCGRMGKACTYPTGPTKRRPTTQILESRFLELQLKVNSLTLAPAHNLSLASRRLSERIQRLGKVDLQQSEDLVWLAIYPQLEDEDAESQLPNSRGTGHIVHKGVAPGYTPVIKRSVVEHEIDLHHWIPGTELPLQLSSYLINLFLPYRSQFQFFMDVPYFLRCLSLPSTHPEAIHPCLLNACYLGAVSVAGGRLASLQAYFVDRTRYYLQDSLMLADRLTHFLWASMVLGSYFGRIRREDESFVVVSAAARFAAACGLTSNLRETMDSQTIPMEPLLPPPKHDAEASDRIRLAYSIFVTDQTMAAVCGRPWTFLCDDWWTSISGQTLVKREGCELLTNEGNHFSNLWQSEAHLKACTMKIFQRVNSFARSISQKDEKARHAEYCSLKDQICFYHLKMPPLSDPCGLRPSESVSTLNPHLLVAHTTLYGSGMILHSLRSDTNSEARGHMLACARRLLEICEKIRGHARLFKVQTALMPMLHMMNGIRVVARELRASVVRGDATQCADYCLAIESALDFLDDVTTSYPAWVDVPIALKDTLLSAARTLPH